MQSDDIHIPPSAVEAAAWYLWKNGYTPHRDISENVARAAIRAALAAWPGIKLTPYWEHMTHKRRVEMILPLTENADG